MSERILLRPAVTEPVTILVVRKKALYGWKCQSCGKIYGHTGKAQNLVHMMFDKRYFMDTSDDSPPRGSANFTSINVCSQECGAAIVTGGWKTAPDAIGFAKTGATPIRFDMKISAGSTRSETDLVKSWDAEALAYVPAEISAHDLTPKEYVGIGIPGLHGPAGKAGPSDPNAPDFSDE